jgi:Zn-dependent protease with chaperone function
MAHEIAHVVHRHTTRSLVQHGIINVGLGLALGDTSWLFSNASALLTTLHYSRRHETEADCYAIALMRAANRPTRPMGELLLRITKQAPAAEGDSGRKEAGWGEMLDTHPDTPVRAQALADGRMDSCD